MIMFLNFKIYLVVIVYVRHVCGDQRRAFDRSVVPFHPGVQGSGLARQSYGSGAFYFDKHRGKNQNVP